MVSAKEVTLTDAFVVCDLLRAGLRCLGSLRVSHQRAISSYCLDQVLELKDVISALPAMPHKNHNNLHFKYFNMLIQPLKFWHLFGKRCLQRGIFSKHYI